MPAPKVCVDEILREKDELWEGEYPSEIFWTASENLYDAALRNEECFKKLKEADRVTYQELRRAFSPNRTIEDVMWAGDKVLRLANRIICNSDIFDYSSPPSCDCLGLGDEDYYCTFSDCDRREIIYESGEEGITEEELEERLKGCRLECDCEGGYRSYNPLEYAYDNVVFRAGDKVKMYYSDFPQQLARCARMYEEARAKKNVAGMVIALDCMVSSAHASGPLAEFLVKGGTRTLDVFRERKYGIPIFLRTFPR